MFARTPTRNNLRKLSPKNIKHSPLTTDDSETEENYYTLGKKSQTIEVVREIFRLGLQFKIPIDTIHLAISWLEQYECTNVLKYSNGGEEVPKTVKLAIVFVALSCKFNQYRQVSISDLAYKYGRKAKTYFVVLEEKILLHLQFEIPESTPSKIFNQYFSNDEVKLQKCNKLFMKYILDPGYNVFGYQLLSKAIVNSIQPQKWPEQNMAVRIQIKVMSKELK